VLNFEKIPDNNPAATESREKRSLFD
jgi:hypothetical protein